MKNKKLVPVLLLLFLSPSFRVFAAANCECGEHATGITTYNVSGEDCCASTPGAVAFDNEYEQQTGGAWKLVRQTQITGTAAQSSCCPPQ